MPVIRRFPFTSLPRVSRLERAAAAGLRRHLGAQAAVVWERWAERLLGAPTGNATLRLRSVHALAPASLIARLRHGVAFSLTDSGAGQLVLVLDAGLAAQLVRGLLRAGVDLPPTPPGPMQHGLLAFALGWLLADLGAASSWTVEQGPPSLGAALERGDAVVEGVLALGGQQGLLWLLAAPRTLAALPPAPIAQRNELERFGALRWAGAIECGRFALPLAAIERLAPGDIILSPALRHGAAPAEAGLRLRVGRASCAVSLARAGLRLTGAFERQRRAGRAEAAHEVVVAGTAPIRPDAPAVEATESPPQDAETARYRVRQGDRGRPAERARGELPMNERVELERQVIDELEVELVVELGRVELSLAELSRLGVGDVLALGQPLGGGVDVWAGGRRIGRGELVDVDGETGVRLTELFA